ncbi:MAG: hypothetical protein C0403_06485 [Desulfobacterium sp.]|nr:hypothetical protein [Desulfobacterium sp.]
MPPFETHLETSKKRTGKDYSPLHAWLDNDSAHKKERHDLDLLVENRNHVLMSWGEEAVREFFQHIVEDLAMKDIDTLKKAGCPDEAIEHSIEVARKALEISSRIKRVMDRKLIVLGAIYHDLGKARTYGMQHGEIGAQMAVELGLDAQIIDIILKHIRGGLTEPEAVELNLPVRDYTLRTPEEKIVIYADRLVDIYTDGIVPDIDENGAEARFEEILTHYEKYGKNAVTLKRYMALNKELHQWMDES